MLRYVAALVAGYVAGNLPTADIVARLAGPDDTDLRTLGSRNPGAVNVGRELGAGWGALVTAVDVSKGAVAAGLGRAIVGPAGANLAATAAVAGHCYPVGRTGGKGVATSIGQVIGTFPRYLPIDMAVAVAAASVPGLRQRTYTATAVASGAWIGSAALAWARRWSTGTDDPAPASLPVAAAISSALIARRFSDTPLTGGRPS